jgi:multidrug resistance efflux pump
MSKTGKDFHMKKTLKVFTFFTLLLCMLMQSACTPAEENNISSFQIDELGELDLLIEGRIVPHQWVALSFSGSGLVEEIYFDIGEIVQAGDVIARLSGQEQLSASMAAVELELLSAQQAFESLDKNHKLAKAQALTNRITLQQAIASARINIKNLKEKDWDKEIDSAKANIVLLENRLEQARDRYKDYENRSDENLTKAEARINLSNALKQLEEADALLTLLENSDPNLEIKKAESDLTLIQEQLTKALEIEADLKNGPLPEEMELAQKRLATAQAGVESAKAALNSLQLVAPFDGVILESMLKKGQFNLAGQQAVILADTSRWLVETNDLTEIDRVNVSVGQAVTITPDALPDMDIQGYVLRISDYYQENRGDITYKTIIQLADTPAMLEWGMTVLINFETD